MQRLYALVALVVPVLFSSTTVLGKSDRLDAEFRFGEAVLRGRVVNNGGEKMTFSVSDGGMFDRVNMNRLHTTTDEEGNFEFRLKNCVPWISYLLSSSHEVGLRVEIFSTPCDTVDMIIDMAAFKRKNDKELAPAARDTIYQQIKMLNDKLIAKIEADKKNADYRIYDLANIESDKLISHIQPLFPTKMLVIDFWATWCAPCVMANREYAPVKKEFKDKDVVFVYITNPTSPKQTWENMLATIPGEHFYTSDKQGQYLTEKYNFRGVPSYLYIDRDGKQLDFHTGDIRTDEFRKKITDGIK